MPDEWTGELIGRMHNAKITADDLVEELHCCKSYVSMILNGTRSPKGCKEKFEAAFQAILSKK